MAVIYNDLVQWYCEECGDEGEAQSQRGAEEQVRQHECVPKEGS